MHAIRNLSTKTCNFPDLLGLLTPEKNMPFILRISFAVAAEDKASDSF